MARKLARLWRALNLLQRMTLNGLFAMNVDGAMQLPGVIFGEREFDGDRMLFSGAFAFLGTGVAGGIQGVKNKWQNISSNVGSGAYQPQLVVVEVRIRCLSIVKKLLLVMVVGT